jgi:hypothetical protein
VRGSKLRQRFPSAQAAQVGDEALGMQDKYLGGYANMPDGVTATAASATLAARLP